MSVTFSADLLASFALWQEVAAGVVPRDIEPLLVAGTNMQHNGHLGPKFSN